jgi:transcriptional regulator with XRE-family HTH domain
VVGTLVHTSAVNLQTDPNVVSVNIGELALGVDSLPAGPIYLDWTALQEAPDDSRPAYQPTTTMPSEPRAERRALAAAILAFIVSLSLTAGQLGASERFQPQTEAAASKLSVVSDTEAETSEAPHAAAARELRDMTSLSAADLAAIIGVTRESYQRWLGGGSIKPLNESLLYYVRAILRDAVRRLGQARMNEWLRAPVEVSHSSVSPLDMIRAGRVDEVHALVVRLRDPRPIVNDQVVALQRAEDDTEDTWIHQ